MKSFDIKNFISPGSPYRGLPFWAWNTDVTAEAVIHEIETFKKMGFGGFIIHARKGLRTEYMGKHFMDMVRLSMEKAKELDLRVWLYDEDGWPSGYAGGAVTLEKKYRQKTLLFTKAKIPSLPKNEAIEKGEPYHLASFDVTLRDGYLESYSVGGSLLHAYVITAPDNPRFNGQAYIDTMNGEAVELFLSLTHDKYFELFGNDFGKTVEAIFTDEPQLARVNPLSVSDIGENFELSVPWSDDLPQTYEKTYGEDIVVRLPEIIFEMHGRANTTRYRFNAHLADRFRNAFSKPIADRCRKQGIKFTGHYLFEQSLEVQAHSLRDVMRNYADQDIPGIDVLLGGYEFTTALQCRSVARQSGKTQLMSELYGVTNYTADFRDYVHFGNWQAALGVTERVPHLTWMSMLGEGKRDYPANFGYQAPWCGEFSKLENHFARINTALTAGVPRVRVGVIHPIESHWLIYGPDDKTLALRQKRDLDFHELCEWLLFSKTDFDYVNESLLPEQFDGARSIGEMTYDAILVPDCLTLRRSTLDVLKKLKSEGVRIIFAGEAPKLIDACPSDEAQSFAKACECIPLTKDSVLRVLENYRAFELVSSDGSHDEDHIFCEREDENGRTVFITPAKEITDKENSKPIKYTLVMDGELSPMCLDTFKGEQSIPLHEQKGGKTYVYFSLYAYDSILLRFSKGQSNKMCPELKKAEAKELKLSSPISVRREGQNVLLLDMAEYSLDGETYFSREEILRVDLAARRAFSLPLISGKVSPQPWSVTDDVKRSVFLRFSFECTAKTEAFLAFEKAKSISLNGENISLSPTGHYVDRDIKKVALSPLKAGKNVLCAEVEISKTVGTEPMYLLGDFDVTVKDGSALLSKPAMINKLAPSAELGMPFYSDNLLYELEFFTEGGDIELEIPKYRGALLSVSLDGKYCGDIILPPYTLKMRGVERGEHKITVTCFGNRNNTFGSLHWAHFDPYVGAMHWHKTGDDFSYDYKLCDLGLLAEPKLRIISI